MGFSKKAKKGTGSQRKSNIDWDGFNQEKLDVIGDEEARPAVISGIVDFGLQERPDYVEKYVKGDDDHERNLESGRSHLSDDGKEIITELAPIDQIGVFVDFPELMVNYGKFFSEDGKDEYRPYRHLLTGEFKGEARGISLSCQPNDKAESGWAYAPNSFITKIARAANLADGSVVDQDFDLGDLLGCQIQVSIGAQENGEYVNITARDPSKLNKKLYIEDHDVKPFGVDFEGGNSDEDLEQVMNKSAIVRKWESSPNWKDSKLKAEIEELQNKSKKVSPKSNKEEKEEKPKKKPAAKKSASKNTSKVKPKAKESQIDFDDNIPF